jgi:hypothetical protein
MVTGAWVKSLFVMIVFLLLASRCASSVDPAPDPPDRGGAADRAP